MTTLPQWSSFRRRLSYTLGVSLPLLVVACNGASGFEGEDDVADSAQPVLTGCDLGPRPVSPFSFTPSAVLYVDKDDGQCSNDGPGSTGRPLCSIAAAMTRATAGTAIRIRSAENPYDEHAISTRSGTPDMPIVIEPDAGHAPKLVNSHADASEGAIELRGASHWVIQGLTFDGTGRRTSMSAIRVLHAGVDVENVRILNNQFSNWGTESFDHTIEVVALRGGGKHGSTFVKGARVAGNRFTGYSHMAIMLSSNEDTVVEDNSILDGICGLYSDGRVGVQAIKVGAEGVRVQIRRNLVGAFQRSAECPLVPPKGKKRLNGIYCDTGAEDGVVERNVVFDIDPGTTEAASKAIYMESRCLNWRVNHNLIYDVGETGLGNGSNGTMDPSGTRWFNNTVVNGAGQSFVAHRGPDLKIKNNLFVLKNGSMNMSFSDTAASQGGHRIDYNLYWDKADGAKVGAWGNKTVLDFTQWKTACHGCDQHSVNQAPKFVDALARNYSLSPDSPALHAGTDVGLPFDGPAPHIGACGPE